MDKSANPPSEDHIAASVRGMIRNFGISAEGNARSIARRMAMSKDGTGARVWLAIAFKIAEIEGRIPDRPGAPAPILSAIL
jgi:hypothetical protein